MIFITEINQNKIVNSNPDENRQNLPARLWFQWNPEIRVNPANICLQKLYSNIDISNLSIIIITIIIIIITLILLSIWNNNSQRVIFCSIY